MKKLLFPFFLLLISVSNYAQYNWTALPNAPISWRCDDIYFLNSKIGWAIHAYYDYLTPTQYGQVYKTWDGGNTWTLMHDSSKTFYRAVGFIDSLHGWIGNIADTTHYPVGQYTKDTIPLYYTTDGGRTLMPQNLGYPHPTGICGISVVNDSVVYAYGRYSSPAGYVKTTNRGNTWVYHNMSALAYGMVDGWFFNNDTGFITGASPAYKAQILSTVDGGNTWQIAYRSTRADTDQVWKIFFPSRDTGYASIEYEAMVTNQDTMHFLKTTDGGKTWKEMIFSTTPYDLEGIGFINDTIGWIGGDWEQPTYITYDGGSTWSPDNGFGILTSPYILSNYSYVINRFRKINDTLIYASGNTVYKLSGKITGMNQIKNNKYVVNNYPNPYKLQTTIKYSLSQTCHNVKLEIFALGGQVLFSQNLGEQEPGNHEYVFKNTIPGGAYFYTLASDEFIITRKMLKVK